MSANLADNIVNKMMDPRKNQDYNNRDQDAMVTTKILKASTAHFPLNNGHVRWEPILQWKGCVSFVVKVPLRTS